MSSQNFYLKQMEIGPMQNYVYLIGDPKTKEAAVVDPAWEAKTILNAVQQDGYQLKHILLTHTHYDHVNALEDILQKTDAKVYVHAEEAQHLPVASENIVKTENGDQIVIGNISIKVLYSPGHTPGSQCFLAEGHLFSGDTLFIDYCGRSDLPGGDSRKLHESLHDCLGRLPDETVVCPGHNYSDRPTSTIGKEKKDNPYLAAQSLEEFLRHHGKMI